MPQALRIDIVLLQQGVVGGNDELVMNLIAKTYRYLEEDEIEAAAASKKGKRR